MPIESADTTKVEPFNKSENPYDRLRFDNTETEWKQLQIGYQNWLCSELQKFAQDEELEITVRFISWDQAHHEIDSLGKAFDLIQIPSTWTAYLIDQGLLAKWEGDVNLQKFAPKLLNTCRIEGHKDIHAIPWQLDVRVLFYRQELTDDPNRLLTFDDFLKCLEDRKKRMNSSPDPVWKSPFCIARDRDWDILHNTLRYFWNGKIIEEYLWFWWRPAFDSDDGMEGIAKLHDMAKKDLVYFASLAEADGKQGWYGLANGLLDGKFDAVFGGIYMRTVFDRRPDVKILAAPLPQLLPDQNKTFLGGSHLAVTTAAPRPYARSARKLIQRLTSEQSGIAMFKHTNAIPANKKALNNFFQSNPRWQTLDMNTLLESAEAYPSIPQWAKLETDVVLDNFHTILRAIASGQSQQKIEFHVQNAAKEVWYILLIYPLIKVFPILLAILAVFIVIIVWLLWRSGGLKRELNKAKNEADQLTSTFQEVREELSARLQETGHTLQNEIAEKFGSIDANLKESCQSIAKVADSSLPAAEHQQLNNLSDSLETLHHQIASIQSSLPNTGSLEYIKEKLEILISRVEKIYDTVSADQEKVLLKDCELKVNIKYEEPNVKLELKLHYDDGNKKKLDWTRSIWSREIPLFFELLMLRMFLSREYQKASVQQTTNIYLSDYYLVKYPYFTDLKDPKDATSHFFRGIRQEVYNALPPGCIITDRDGRRVSRKEFMLRAIGKERRKKKYSFDEQRTTVDKRKDNNFQITSRAWIPAYVFVLPQQVNSFRCNIFDTTFEIKDKIGKLSPDDTCKLMVKCPPCLAAWEFLSKNLSNLSQDSKDSIKEYKNMLRQEVNRYSDIASFFNQESGKKRLLDLEEIKENKERDRSEEGWKAKCQELTDLEGMWKVITERLDPIFSEEIAENDVQN